MSLEGVYLLVSVTSVNLLVVINVVSTVTITIFGKLERSRPVTIDELTRWRLPLGAADAFVDGGVAIRQRRYACSQRLGTAWPGKRNITVTMYIINRVRTPSHNRKSSALKDKFPLCM